MDKRNLFIILALVAAVFVLYAPVRAYPFVGFDDPAYVTGNPHVRTGLTAANLAWAVRARYESTWQPVTWITYQINQQLHGMRPGGYHLGNVLFHAAAAALLFMALTVMTRRRWPSALVAALFALHPLHVEPVAWIAARKDTVSTMFWMLTLYGYARYTQRPGIGRYVGVAAAFTLGLMAKPMLVTLPFVLLLLDFWPLKRFAAAGTRRLLIEKAPLVLPAAGIAVVAFIAQHQGGALSSMEDLPLMPRLANAAVAYVRYLSHLVLPRNLAVLYPLPARMPLLHALAAGMFLAAVSTAAVMLRRGAPFVTTGWFWFAGTLVPVIGIVQFGMHGMADRFAYIPAVGIYLCLAWAADAAVRRLRPPPAAVAGAAGLLLLVLAAGARHQLRFWRDGEALFRHTLAVTEDNWMIENSLGATLERQGRLDEAEAHFRRAASLNPRFGRAYYNLACVLHRKGALRQAVHQYLAAIDRTPRYAPAHFNLAHAFEQLGEPAKARQAYRTTIRLDPANVRAHNNLGSLLKREGRLDDAASRYRAALALEPDYTTARFNLGVVLFEQGRYREALAAFARVLETEPQHEGAQAALRALAREPVSPADWPAAPGRNQP